MLPSVLWITILSIAIAANYASAVHVNTRTADNIKTSMQLKYDATSGIYIALDRMLSVPSVINTRFRIEVNDSDVDIAITPENLKIDINSADYDKLRTRFAEAGLDDDAAIRLAARVIDWRDTDHSTRPYGLEDSDYYGLGKPYGARDGRIEDLVELLLMADIDKNLFLNLSDHFTVYNPRAGRIITLTARASRKPAAQSYVTRATVQVTYQADKPYRILKWQHNHG